MAAQSENKKNQWGPVVSTSSFPLLPSGSTLVSNDVEVRSSPGSAGNADIGHVGLSHYCTPSSKSTAGGDADSDKAGPQPPLPLFPRIDLGRRSGGSGVGGDDSSAGRKRWRGLASSTDGEDDGRNPPSLSPTKPDPPLFRHRHLSRSGHYDVGSEIGGKKVCDISSALICRHESPPLAPPPRVAPKSFACLN
uniref:Uncharacterized protein n=1 Tax=Oryza nivara TaxID=4536 RepID=A0A0E0GX07_ORYNI